MQRRKAGKKKTLLEKFIRGAKVVKSIVVLDTNIFISSVFWEGASYAIVKKAISQEIIVFISNDIIEELRKVLARDFSLELAPEGFLRMLKG